MEIKLIKATRKSDNQVDVEYSVDGVSVTVEWNNIHPGTGEEAEYDLQLNTKSDDAELALIGLPLAGVVVPNHPGDSDQREDRQNREEKVQLVDVVVVDTFALLGHSRSQMLKKNSGNATKYFRLITQRRYILMGTKTIMRNRKTAIP